jgi:hypothetical protein
MRPEDVVTTLMPQLAYKAPAKPSWSQPCWRQQKPPPHWRPLRDEYGTAIVLPKYEPPLGGSGLRRRPIHEDSDLLYLLLWHNHDLLPERARDRVRDLPAGPLRWFELARLYGLLRRQALGRLREYAAQLAQPVDADPNTGLALRAGAFGSDFDDLLQQIVDERAPGDRWFSPQFWRCPTPLMINRAARPPCTSTWWCPYCYVREAYKLYRALKYTAVHIQTTTHAIRSVNDYRRVRDTIERAHEAEERRAGRLPDALIWLRWWPPPESICDSADIHDQLDVITLTPGGNPLCTQTAEFVAAFAYPVGWLTVEDPRRSCYILNQTCGLRNRRARGIFGDLIYER